MHDVRCRVILILVNRERKRIPVRIIVAVIVEKKKKKRTMTLRTTADELPFPFFSPFNQKKKEQKEGRSKQAMRARLIHSIRLGRAKSSGNKNIEPHAAPTSSTLLSISPSRDKMER